MEDDLNFELVLGDVVWRVQEAAEDVEDPGRAHVERRGVRADAVELEPLPRLAEILE